MSTASYKWVLGIFATSSIVGGLAIWNCAQAASKEGEASLSSAELIRLTHESHTLVKLTPAQEKYFKSSTHKKRHDSYSNGWTNPKATVKYADGSKQTIELLKSPYDQALQAMFKTHPLDKKKTKADKDQNGWVTSTQRIEMTANSGTFMNNDFADASARIYPGAVFTADNFEHGDYKPVTGTRNPVDIATDNPNMNGSSYVTVKDPDVDHIRDAVATLTRRMTGKAGTDGFSADVYGSSNDSSWGLQVSGGGSYMGISASDSFSMNKSSSSVYLTVDASLPLYSISAMPADNGYFASQKQENDPNLVVVSNVVYGMRVLANITITLNSTEEADDFHASLNWGVVSAEALTKFVTKHSDSVSSFHAFVIGGNAGDTSGLITLDPKSFLNGIKHALKGATYQNARPISYQLSDMGDDILMSNSLTEYTTVSSGPKDYNPKINFIDCSFLTGQDGKDADTNLNVYLYPPSYAANPQVDDMDGAIYGYQSQGHSYAFGGGQESTVPMFPGDGGKHFRKPLTPNDLIRQNGGRVRIHIYPNGHDTWDVTQASLILHYDDNTEGTIQLTGPSGGSPFVVSQTVPVYDLVFTGAAVKQ